MLIPTGKLLSYIKNFSILVFRIVESSAKKLAKSKETKNQSLTIFFVDFLECSQLLNFPRKNLSNGR